MASRRRWRWSVVLVPVVMAAVFVGGWVLAGQFESPAQREARARPPEAGPIFEPVRVGALRDVATAAGRLRLLDTEELVPVELAANAVVTAQPRSRLDGLVDGDVLTEINGRPLIVVSGTFDFYRDLGLDSVGPDVAQLQVVLARAGWYVTPDGVFGKTTLAAIRALYASRGYELDGKVVPLTELVVARQLPAQVVEVPLVGSHPMPGEPVSEVGTGDIAAVVAVDGPVASRLRQGLSVSISGASNRAMKGKIVQIRQNRQGFSDVTVEIRSDVDAVTLGRRVVAEFVLSDVSARALIVPTRAVVRSGDAASVLVDQGDGSVRDVPVEVLGELNGMTALRRGGELRARDHVQVR